MEYRNITKEFIDKPVILISSMTESILSLWDDDSFEARESLIALKLEELLNPLKLIVADPQQDPKQGECVIYGKYDDGARNYLGSPDDSDMVKGMAYRLTDADRYVIYDVDRDSRQCLIMSKKSGKFLSVDISESMDPDKDAFRIFANKETPDDSCLFYYKVFEEDNAMNAIKGISTEEYIARNKSAYEDYEKWNWDKELTVGQAKVMISNAMRITDKHIVPALRKVHARFDNGRVKFQNDSVRVEGSKDGFIVINLKDGKVVFHTDFTSHPQIKQNLVGYDGDKIEKMIVNG